ncbi:MAG: ABC transporter permease [Proteobacteria bacterium]|nr:ABC transporter permease [Pseudomonadota bacterium]
MVQLLFMNPVFFIGISLLLVFIMTSMVLILTGAPPFSVYKQIFLGSLSTGSKFGHVIKAWIPLTLCAIGLLYTFRINLWNIGVEGQMIIGAVFCTFIIRLFPNSPYPIMILFLAFFSSMMGGALWALLAGFLKTKGGVNEIFAGLGLNFVAQGLILWLIFGPWKRPGVASMSGTEIIPKGLWLSLIERTAIPPAGLILTFLALFVTYLLLKYTKIGLGLKAIGLNPKASLLFGLKPSLYMLLAMVFGGGLAGFAGCIQVTGVYHRLIPSISSNYGYLALLVVMLSNYDIRLVPIVSFFFSCLNVGSIQLPMVLHIDSSLSGVIQGSLVLTFLALHALHRRLSTPKEIQPS